MKFNLDRVTERPFFLREIVRDFVVRRGIAREKCDTVSDWLKKIRHFCFGDFFAERPKRRTLENKTDWRWKKEETVICACNFRRFLLNVLVKNIVLFSMNTVFSRLWL